jgi:transcriptional regulator with XRE-family HTH domain
MYGSPESTENKKLSFKEFRDKLGVSQGQLAILLGTDRSEINRLENGRRLPEWLEKAIRLTVVARKAGISVEDLILSLPDPAGAVEDGADHQT